MRKSSTITVQFTPDQFTLLLDILHREKSFYQDQVIPDDIPERERKARTQFKKRINELYQKMFTYKPQPNITIHK